MWRAVKQTLAIGATAVAVLHMLGGVDAIKVDVSNMCETEIDLVHLEGAKINTEKLAAGASVAKYLAGDSQSNVFKSSMEAQATLAEITAKSDGVYFDISVIPTGSSKVQGSVGPGDCVGFDECKRITGGHSFNVPMQIVPGNGACMTLTCMADGCPDAYLYPSDKKTRFCAPGTDFKVIFCPGGPGGPTPEPTPAPTPAPTPPPTTPPPTTPAPSKIAANEDGVVSLNSTRLDSGSGSGTAARSGDRFKAFAGNAGVDTPSPKPTSATPTPTPAGKVVEVTTKSSNEGSTGAEVYVLSSVGAVAMLAGVAIFVVRRKKQQLEALEEKSPRPTTTVAASAFFMVTPNDTSVL